VRELRLNGDRYRYEIAQDEPHQHMVCLECGRVIEFTCGHCAKVHMDLADKYGFRITGARVKLWAIAPTARRAIKTSTVKTRYVHT
jgi:Fur family ferric uptake transcriptional regulator